MEKQVINTQIQGTFFKHFWNTCIGAGRACEGLRFDWQKQLKMTVTDCGFRYIRFHGLLCDEMGIYQKRNGVVFYNYTYVDMLFDSLLEARIRPFVEFGFMPDDLASGTGTQFWWKGNVTPPKDYDAWAKLLTNLISHWILRYGKAEVLNWYFEIWNEPNLYSFWNGTKSEYFHLYEVSVKAIKSLCPNLRVGGPATSNFVPDERFAKETEDFNQHKTHLVDNLQSLEWKGVWLEDFFNFCTSKKLPIDFLSTHPYPTDFALDGHDNLEADRKMKGRSRYVNSLKDDLMWIQKLISNSSYPNIEVHLTEWSSSPTSRDYSHDYLPAATYVIKSNLDSIGLTDSLSYWVFTDIFEEVGPGPEAFHGGFGLLTMHGIKKPTYHAYEFLNQLGENLLAKANHYIITKNNLGKLKGIVYHYPDEIPSTVPISVYPDYNLAEEIQNTGNPLPLSIELIGLKPGTKFTLETLDVNHGNVTTLWKEFGYPKNLTLEQSNALSAFSEAFDIKVLEVNDDGILSLHLTMSPWSITFLSET